jgi:hypothetical protein
MINILMSDLSVTGSCEVASCVEAASLPTDVSSSFDTSIPVISSACAATVPAFVSVLAVVEPSSESKFAALNKSSTEFC